MTRTHKPPENQRGQPPPHWQETPLRPSDSTEGHVIAHPVRQLLATVHVRIQCCRSRPGTASRTARPWRSDRVDFIGRAYGEAELLGRVQRRRPRESAPNSTESVLTVSYQFPTNRENPINLMHTEDARMSLTRLPRRGMQCAHQRGIRLVCLGPPSGLWAPSEEDSREWLGSVQPVSMTLRGGRTEG
jgi:hypothetical protein